MIRPLELAIGLRYTRAKRRNHFISFISLSSMLGIALGVTALITVLSVMNGFEKELKSRILGMASHATIAGFDGPLEDWRGARGGVESHPEVLGVAPYVNGEGMLTSRGNVNGAIVRGVLPALEPEVSQIADHLVVGKLDELESEGYGMLLGTELAARLQARVGDKVTLVVPQANVTPAGVMPRLRRFTVKGLFKVGHGQYDNGLALIHIEDAARLFKLPDGAVTGLRLQLDDMDRAPGLVRELAQTLGGRYWVSDWTQHHANFFRALKIEKRVMFIILALIVAVAAFNIVSTLVMVVTDKQSDIAILRTLGLSPASVLGVFVIQGTMIGLIGTVLGGIGGVVLALNVETIVSAIEQAFGMQFLDSQIYYISELPSDMRWPDVMTVLGVSFAMSALATLYPAFRASRVHPAEALRYE